MWTVSPQHLSRTSSMHSLARSVTSSHGSTYAESIDEIEFPVKADMWRPQAKAENMLHIIQLERRDSLSSDTLSGPNSFGRNDLDIREDEMDPKTPTVRPAEQMSQAPTLIEHHEHAIPAGPLEQQLLSILSKISHMERDQPTVMAEDYKLLEDRLRGLEADQKAWQRRHEALYALRDEDLANLITVRCLLANERREHTAIRNLRDDDLHNVLELRDKLAKATWSKPAEPSRSRQSRPESDDLWHYAKTAALEQRVLELEKHNEELLKQIETKGDWTRMEGLLEENLRYREKTGQRVQQLRSEKEVLQKELSRLEDENADLEVKVERLQRRTGL